MYNLWPKYTNGITAIRDGLQHADVPHNMVMEEVDEHDYEQFIDNDVGDIHSDSD